MNTLHRRYLPAAGHDWLLPLYDPFVKLLGGDRARCALIEQAALRSGQRALDVGCGTGTLVVLLKQQHPDVAVVGVDPDQRALGRARRKADRARLDVQLDQGFADRLPYAATSFDHVFSSFMLHHVPADEKTAALREARRVLRPGGGLHLLDFGGPGPGPRGLVARFLHADDRLRDNFDGKITVRMCDAGFADAHEVGHRALLFGEIVYYRATAGP